MRCFSTKYYYYFQMVHQQLLSQNTFFVLFPQTFFLANLISLSVLNFFGSVSLVSEFLVVSCSLTACCECWLPCVRLSLLYENMDNVYVYIYIYTIYINDTNSLKLNGATSLKNEDKNTTIKPDPMKRFDNSTDNRVLRGKKRKSYAGQHSQI